MSDYTLPDYSGLLALEQVRAHDPDLPFIIVSGNIGDGVAVAAMKASAQDYLIKGNLARLGAAIVREVSEAAVRHARRDSERELAAARMRLKAFSGRRRWMGCHIDITEQRLLLEALRSQEARVGELNLTLEERVRARTAELEAANRELDAFNHSVSHDLRVPLRSIAGFSQALSENHAAVLDASGQDYLRRIDHAARRMDRLIDALHRLSRLPRAPLHLRSIDLSSRVEAIIAELRAAEPLRQVEVCVAPNLLGDGDPALLALLLANLVGNAWKFTSRTPGARIEFGAAADAHGNRALFVRDNGVGFDMQFADRLFTPFRRLHREEEFSGSGIGLATAQRIVQRHGGRIWAQAAKGRGASFHFTLWDDVALRHELEHGLRARIA